MAKHGGKFNFRYASQRDAFYKKLLDDYKETRDKLGVAKGSSLRVIFEFQEFSPKERKEQEKQWRKGHKNAFRGMRYFANLESLERFVTTAAQGGSGISWGRKELTGQNMRASVRRYVKQGTRIVKEETYHTYDVESEPQ